MFASVLSAVMTGLDVSFVRVEADVSDGFPGLHMVGYLASEVREAGERVRTALRNSGIRMPSRRIIINLAPAGIRKQGALFDLAIAVTIAAALGEVPLSSLKDILLLGEISLNGRIGPVRGVLPMVRAAHACHIGACILPRQNMREARLTAGIDVIGVSNVHEVLAYLRGESSGHLADEDMSTHDRDRSHTADGTDAGCDFSDICGQRASKRAALIAASGCHNVLLTGPPGSGKTMTAERLSSIMPPLSLEESMQLSSIYSVAGIINEEDPLITKRPFRAPHHTVSAAALIGGGSVPKPGEVTLASYGVLFLDELTEYRRPVLDLLRQPLEDRMVRICRSRGTFIYPADFILFAAMNPCPCGYYPDPERCTCSDSSIRRYMSRISRPLLDRIDICMEAEPVTYEELEGSFVLETSVQSAPETVSSETMRRQAYSAWMIQQERFKGERFSHNGRIPSQELSRWCSLSAGCTSLMRSAFRHFGMSARSCHRALRTARTIADLDGEESIHEEHLAEALGYRLPESHSEHI